MINDYIKDIKMFNKNKNLKLLKYEDNESYIIIHIDLYSYPIKIITDLDKYCYADSIIKTIGIDKFNLSICFKCKNITTIINELENNICIKNTSEIELPDSFHIFQKIDKYDKTNINYYDLTRILINNICAKKSLSVPLIINEIQKVNENKKHNHTINIDPFNILSLIVKLELDDKTIELRIIIDPYLYSYVPPKIEYVKPKINIDLLFAITNLDILIIKNWCSIISLEYIIVNLAEKLNPIINNHIIKEFDNDIDELEYEITNLAYTTKEKINNQFNINIPMPVQSSTTKTNSHWKSGTGYGSSSDVVKWDINKYVLEQESEIEKIAKILVKINDLITPETLHIITNSVLESYILKHTLELTILELDKNNILYMAIFEILYKLINNNISQSFINIIYNNIKNIYEDINDLLINDKQYETHSLFLLITSTSKLFLLKYNETIKEIMICSDHKEKYCEIMKPLQFGNYELPKYHYFGKNINKLNKSAIMRTISEISSFKTGLPLNWESSIWVRISKTNINLFSFIISGPKDTPYENGLFEFHVQFPVDYPDSPPCVIIYTTDGGKIRFNPNLYANGKVCLSLLGTWSGQENEKWNSKTSTFIQVMISIQSLILVEQPIFNEPGYEKSIGTAKGDKLTRDYNKKIYPETIRLGMINMIKNPPPGFEDVVKNHFSMKKEEIIQTITKWEQDTENNIKSINNNKELFKLFETM